MFSNASALFRQALASDQVKLSYVAYLLERRDFKVVEFDLRVGEDGQVEIRFIGQESSLWSANRVMDMLIDVLPGTVSLGADNVLAVVLP